MKETQSVRVLVAFFMSLAVADGIINIHRAWPGAAPPRPFSSVVTFSSHAPFDLVLYELDEPAPGGQKHGLGVVLEDPDFVQPLCAWAFPPKALLWDEESEQVRSSRIIAALNATVFYEQRQMHRKHNPHGDHSEDMFLLDVDIGSNVFVPLRPERENIWS